MGGPDPAQRDELLLVRAPVFAGHRVVGFDACKEAGVFLGEMWNLCNFAIPPEFGGSGGVAEWSMAAVLKTVERQRSGGSNPSASAQCNANTGAARECGICV